MPRGRNCGWGGTWHFEHCFWTVSTKAASGSVSGLPSRPRIEPPAGAGRLRGLGGAEDGEEGKPEEKSERRKTSRA